MAKTDLVAFDACVLVDALCNSRELEFQLLTLASLGGPPIGGFTTDVCGLELWRNALEGVNGGRRFTEPEIERFLDLFDPMFGGPNIMPSPIGASINANPALLGQPLATVIEALTGQTGPSLTVAIKGLHPTVDFGRSPLHFDPADLHLILASLDAGADIICTSNTTDFSMDAIGPMVVMTPEELGDELGLI